MNQSRIIVSLDFPESERALAFVKQLDPQRCRLKVGKELFTNSGPLIVERLTEAGFDIFLDLKFHDIPNTVAGACRAAAGLGVWMINVHAMGGRKMLQSARDAIDSSSHQPLLVAVTVLTSMSSNDIEEIGITTPMNELVLKLALISAEAGVDGVVCSAKEAQMLRTRVNPDFCLVTPGIRPAESAKQDQNRVVTPEEAILAGSNYLVIGRPIIEAIDPLMALEAIDKEVNKALSQVASR